MAEKKYSTGRTKEYICPLCKKLFYAYRKTWTYKTEKYVLCSWTCYNKVKDGALKQTQS